MKTFLGFALGVFVGAYGLVTLLITTSNTDILIRNTKDFCGMK